MVRNYKRKKDTTINEDDVEKALEAISNKTMTLRQASEVFGIGHTTLYYRIKNRKDPEHVPKQTKYSSKYTVSQVFDKNEELMLKEYLLKRSRLQYGLTYKQARELAYDYAKILGRCPARWDENKMAGLDWLKGFMSRHSSLSLRKPENTSLSRATSFNRFNVTEFFEKFERVLEKHKFTPDRIFNFDETGISTVVQAPKIIAETGAKQVGQAVSAERGQMITMCGIISAAGNTIPPVFIYPRARFHDKMLDGAPIGSLGLVNSPTSAWINSELFIECLKHIQKVTRCSCDDRILILMDNHNSHCSLGAINFARENGIVLLTFPPHCTHKMQPIDVSVLGPFKSKLSHAQNDWLLNHPGKTITIHNLAEIAGIAYRNSFTPNNILSGFKKTGLVPINRNVFSDEDFECSEVTNRPDPTTAQTSITAADDNVENISSHSLPAPLEVQPQQIENILSPEVVCPFPKAQARQETRRIRKKNKISHFNRYTGEK